jgi:hypothetical protein
MPKLDEDDFVDPGNLPPIAGPKNPPPAGLASPGYGSGASGMSMGGGFGGGTTNIGQQFNAAPAMDRNAAGANAAQGADVLVKHSKESEDWINKKWRPVMGWVYMATCTADFVLFPVLWSALQALSHGSVNTHNGTQSLCKVLVCTTLLWVLFLVLLPTVVPKKNLKASNNY